jgi:hypothetical protein
LAEEHPVLAVAFGAFQQGLVDVGDVLHVPNRVSGVPPHPVDQVEGDAGRRVAHVCRVVGGDATDVHAGHLTGGGGADLTGCGVVEP